MTRMMPRKIKDGTRWEICCRKKGALSWKRCPGTATFATKSNAVVGMHRHENRHYNNGIEKARHRLMASMPFGHEVINE